MEQVLDCLGAFGCRTAAFIGGIPTQALARIQSNTISISHRPYDIKRAATECDFGVCHGGHGTTCELLLKGKPLLLLPIQFEQSLVAKRVTETGAGVIVELENPHRDFKAAVSQLISNPELPRQAKGFASRYSDLTSLSTVTRIANECEAIVRQPRNAS
jgi:UDP:flavonoid glycosyltransferase YjiC (YdhE family)